jgi:4-amino-4-deoxy-L-arabinose transferase-like glycosyltransferase
MRAGDAAAKAAEAAEAAKAAEAAAAPARAAPLRTHAREIVPVLALLVALYVGLFLRLGAVPLFDVDEGAFAEATREMLARGDYVSTWLNGQPRFDKPILIYWLQAASVSAFGSSEFALRLPSSLASCAWVAAVYAFTRRSTDRATGLAAAFIAATSAGVTVIGRAAIADALLNLFLALAMFDIVRFQADGRAGVRRRVFLWIGLGLLTKGPVALLVPGAASALACALLGRLGAWWRALRDPLGWLILLAVAAPWYALEYARRGDAFVAGFFMRHNVERVLSPLQGHSGSPLYYLPAVLLLLLPYSGLFLAALPDPRRWRGVRGWRRAAQGNPVDTFLWCWFLFVFVFFSLASTKLPHYLLYGVTPLFVLMARRRGRLRAGWLAFGPALLFLGAVPALPFVLRYAAPAIHNPYMREALGRPGAFDRAWLAGAGLLFGAVLGLAVWRRAPPWPRLAAAGLACACATASLLLPALAELQQGPVKEAALLARSQGWAVRSWRINAPSFSVYRGAVTPGVSAPAPGMVILTRSDALPLLAPAPGPGQVLYRKGGVVLLRMPG